MTNKISLDVEVQLLKIGDELGEAFASQSLNPFFQWAKIIVTDDEPNLNKQRIPLEEFNNLIKTGLYTPIKMTESEISDGHEVAQGKPVGTITQMAVDGNRLIALSALWKRERPDDIDLLKKMYSEGNPPQVSWELSFSESKEENDGVEALYGTSLNGLTILSNPAYAGRTPFIAMSEKKNKEAYSVEELEKAKETISSLEEQMKELQAKYDELVKTSKASEDELETLREFKKEIDAKAEEVAKMDEIKSKFDEAGIEKNDEFFSSEKERLLAMDENALDFLIQELVAFADRIANASDDDDDEDNDKVDIPPIPGKKVEKLTPAELGRKLRERSKN